MGSGLLVLRRSAWSATRVPHKRRESSRYLESQGDLVST